MHEFSRYHQKADRIMRSQGNQTGRARLARDASPRPVRRSRALILSTGEDIPRGQSLRARMLVIEIQPGDVHVPRLSSCQKDAAGGLYARTMSGFVRWLAGRYEQTQRDLRGEISELRAQATKDGAHQRIPDIVANLGVGFRYFLEFAQTQCVLGEEDVHPLWGRIWCALGEVADAQVQRHAASDAAERFLEMLRTAIASGRAHVADYAADIPSPPAAWGWRAESASSGQNGGRVNWRPSGDCIGWVDGQDVYLEPGASFSVAQRIAREHDQSIGVTQRTLHKRLAEMGLLLSTEQKRKRLTVRKTCRGARRDVLHVASDTIVAVESTQTSQSTPFSSAPASGLAGSSGGLGTPGGLHSAVEPARVRNSM